MTQLTDLAYLMKYIGSRYTFTVHHYPRMATLSSEQERMAFALSHSVSHMQKSIGKLAAECERYDHGGELDPSVIKEAVVKMLINVVKLSETMHIDAEELATSVPGFMAST